MKAIWLKYEQLIRIEKKWKNFWGYEPVANCKEGLKNLMDLA
jgi:hypothetical protein